ncbi:MAG: hypothetical protein JOZ10_17175 [Acidobacteria bacterium]|nr:hypothetical protein [Acidobacteriota bacterium]MBV9436967.1 hypothetical protein [Acidobacteriota bacterium]
MGQNYKSIMAINGSRRLFRSGCMNLKAIGTTIAPEAGSRQLVTARAARRARLAFLPKQANH